MSIATLQFRPIRKQLLLLPIFICCSVIVGGVLYVTHSHAALTAWYKGLGSCFYKSATWTDNFFTPAVKSAGNRYAVAAMILSAGCLLFFVRQWQCYTHSKALSVVVFRSDRLALIFLFSFFFCIWTYGFLNAYPSYDEAFSAMNCARIHPFQTLSYYMIPNNHLLFNLLNSLPAHCSTNPISTGRIISGLVTICLLPLLYFWFRSKVLSPYLSALYCSMLLLQFAAWGFSFQARGYAIYLAACWSSFIFLEYYFLHQNRTALTLHAVAVVIGFFAVPSFLFWEAALLLYIVTQFFWRRQVDKKLIAAQAVAGAFVFLLFTPLLCFSGKASLTENAYVKGGGQSLSVFIHGAWDFLRTCIQYCYSGFVDARNLSYLILFFLPVALLPFLYRRKGFGSVLFFFFAWLSFFLIEAKMQRYPFMRNLVAHDNIALAALLLCLHTVASLLLRRRILLMTGMSAFCLALLIHFIRFNRDHINDSLYFYETDKRYQSLHNAVVQLPDTARVGLSDEGFYWEYLCLRRGIPASMCMGPASTHYIKIDKEPMPAFFLGRAEKWLTADEYEIYRIK